MMKVAVLVCLVMSTSSFAAEAKKNAQGITKEEHMAAEAACKSAHPDIRGKELKECIKDKLGL